MSAHYSSGQIPNRKAEHAGATRCVKPVLLWSQHPAHCAQKRAAWQAYWRNCSYTQASGGGQPVESGEI